MFESKSPVRVATKLENVQVVDLTEQKITPKSKYSSTTGATGSSTGTTGATGSSTGTTGATGSSTGTTGATGSSTGSTGNYADNDDDVVDEIKEEILSTKIILPTGPTGGALATGSATGSNTGNTGSATGATAMNMLAIERSKLWSAIQKKQAVRKRLQATLSKLKQIIQKRLVKVHEAVANATLNMKEAIQVEREASNAMNIAVERLRVYKERKDFVDVVESGLLQVVVVVQLLLKIQVL